MQRARRQRVQVEVQMMGLKSNLLNAGAAILLLSLAGGCVAPSGFGAFLVLNPRWMKRELPAALTPRSDADATRKVDAMRVMRVAEGVRRVEWLEARALSAMRKYPAPGAAVGAFTTTWARALPKETLSCCASFATGHDAVSSDWGDASRPHRQRSDVSLRYDDGTVKRIPAGTSARWIDYIAHGGYALKRIGATNPATLD
jgi:hypothetical protein